MTRNMNAKATTLVGASAIVLGAATFSAFAGGSFDPNVPRGISMSKFAVPGTSTQETCIVPKHIPFAEYRKADEKREQELCKYNFYESSGTTDSSGAVVVCPKTSSTSAGVLLYDIPDGHTKSELQSTSNCLAIEANNRPPSASRKSPSSNRRMTTALAQARPQFSVIIMYRARWETSRRLRRQQFERWISTSTTRSSTKRSQLLRLLSTAL